MKNKVHLICNAHLDPVWQWRWTEGCSEALATFRNAVEILEEYPELIFNHNEAILYQWVQKYDKRLFIQIGQLVDQKRWFIAGGWFLQPDVNLPPYENLVRHIRFGRDYFRSEFGVEPKVAYNFDSFGHPAGLPKLLRDFGYELYIHQRPEKEFLELPDSLYQWKGLDNSIIPAYRIEIGLYHTERKNIHQRLTEATELALRLKRDVALFWGLGNHGGGATRIDLDRIREFTKNEQRVDFLHSTTDRFYEAIKPLIPSLPVYEGSLQRVFTGCYTSLSRIKRKAIEASAAAIQAEALVETHNNASLRDVWHDILFNDFHDILPGTCTEPAEQDALDLYGRALENIRRLNMGSITAINQAAEPLKAHIPVTVFNSNAGLSTFPVEFECMSDYRPFWEGEWVLKLYDRQGKEIPCQEEQPGARLPFHRWRRKISFLAKDLEPGVHHFYLNPVETHNHASPIESRSETQPHTTPLQFIVVPDTADSWGTDTWSWREIAGKFEPVHEERVIETGPVRTIDETTLSYHHSNIILHRITYPDWPVTEYKIRIQWNEPQKRLKIAIPTGMQNATLIAQIPGGSEIFPADSQEHVHGTYLTIYSPQKVVIPTKVGTPSLTANASVGTPSLTANASVGTPLLIANAEAGAVPAPLKEHFASGVSHHASRLCIAHSGLHGFDFDGHEVRLSVLRSAAYCHEQGYNLDNGRSHKFMDMGIHELRLAVWSTPTEDAANVAEWLNAPPLVWAHLPIG